MNSNSFGSLLPRLLLGGSMMLYASSANATGCESAASRIGSDIGKQMATILAAAGCAAVSGDWAACYKESAKWADIADEAATYWNGMAEGTSWQVGPRPIELGAWEGGTIVGTTGRVFISTTTLPSSSCQVTIKELGGKGKTGIAICKVESDGDMTQLKDITFNDSNADQKDKSESKTYTLTGVKGCVLQIHLDGKSVANTFEYKVKIVPTL